MTTLATRRRQSHFPRMRRLVLKVRRGLSGGEKILGAGAAAGIGTYAGMRFGGRLLRPLARIKTLERMSPTLTHELRNVGTHSNALNWALPTAALAIGSKAHDEIKSAARRRYRRWLKTGR